MTSDPSHRAATSAPDFLALLSFHHRPIDSSGYTSGIWRLACDVFPDRTDWPDDEGSNGEGVPSQPFGPPMQTAKDSDDLPFAGLGGSTLGALEASAYGLTTVAHGIVACDEEFGAETFEAMIEDCIEMVRATVRALHGLCGIPFDLPTAERWRYGVAVTLSDGQGACVWPVQFVVSGGLRPSYNPLEEPGDLADAELEAARGSAVVQVFDTRREALSAYYLHGEPRTAVVMAAVTCEAAIELLLGSMLWEEGQLYPEEAAVELSRYRDITAKFASQLAPRLGGSWDPRQIREVAAWHEYVADARNRVVHTGDAPPMDLAALSCQAMSDFLVLMVERLCAPKTIARYPLTALFFLDESGIRSRGLWTRRIKAAAAEASRDELRLRFERWYGTTGRERLVKDRPDPEPTDVRVAYAQDGDGNGYWVQYTARDCRARLIRLEPADPEVEAGVRDFINPGDDFVILGADVACVPVGDWVNDYRLIPGRRSVMRLAATRLSAPDAPRSEGHQT